MTGFDLIAIIIMLSSLLMGYYRGFVSSIGDIAGITGGFILASLVYRAPVKLFRQFDITGTAAEIFLFIICALFFILLLVILIESLKKRVDLKHVADKIAGIIPGTVEGIIFSAMLFFIMSASYNSALEVHRSKIAMRIVRLMPPVYEKLERAGIKAPKMIFLPTTYPDEFDYSKKEIQFLNTGFTSFRGYTCIECGGNVRFEGYFPRIGAAFVPKVVCEECHRTSDGCQTYEGLHKLYGKCPVDMARDEKTRFDCGRWPNRTLVSPKGTCPVDNKALDPWFWDSPQKY